MSLYSALYAGVSGLAAQSGAIATVADNITNVNTVGYKGTRADFTSMVTGGSQPASYSAGGVNIVPKPLISKAGLPGPGSSSTDLAIQGSGFFMVRKSASSDDIAYTRAGSFSPDKQGYLVNSAGLYLQGWPMAADGSFDDSGNMSALTPVKINALAGTAEPTSQMQLTLNLDSRQTPSALAAAYTPGAIASGAVPAQFSRPFQIQDAQGGSHGVTFGFIKVAPNEWRAEVYATPASSVSQPNGLLASGRVAFDAFGQLDMANTDKALFSGFTPGWTNGAGSVPVKLLPGTAAGGGWVQVGEPSAVGTSNVNGGLLGGLKSVEVSKDGIVTATFEKGSPRPIYRLPIATFQNPDGLSRTSGNAFETSMASGNPSINAAGTAGSGAVLGSQLEASTTDLAQEFSDMIRFQRAYSASSKIITTVDEMLQEVSNLKR